MIYLRYRAHVAQNLVLVLKATSVSYGQCIHAWTTSREPTSILNDSHFWDLGRKIAPVPSDSTVTCSSTPSICWHNMGCVLCTWLFASLVGTHTKSRSLKQGEVVNRTPTAPLKVETWCQCQVKHNWDRVWQIASTVLYIQIHVRWLQERLVFTSIRTPGRDLQMQARAIKS